MEQLFVAKNIDDLGDIAPKIVKLLRELRPNLLLFYGEMGVGKTTLIRALCDEFGVTDSVTSPTFAIVNEYLSSQDEVLFHFDLYRIEDIRELYDIGVEDYFFSDNLCLVEWPERAESLLEALKSELSIATINISLGEKLERQILCQL